MTTSAPLFVRNGNDIVNAGSSTTLVHTGELTFALDSQGEQTIFDKSESSFALFEKVRNRVNPSKKFAIVLENGGFVDARIIKNVFESPKTGNLILIGLNGRPVCIFDKEVYSDIEGLADALADVLMDISEGKTVASIEWTAYQK
ncbi:hypothetical protein AB4589_12115 [Vibrio sp. 10N.222.49.A3]|uniref:hypothetical protein n=1 Tax=Gammaproteobacteria TaxID=1236 RepID=UPI0010BD3218|nr:MULTISPECIES: hypothetical protein [Gammaproteobacteria]TKF21953.1 hypothetical protein FCV43_08985 [Vibrio genomosp. F6]